MNQTAFTFFALGATVLIWTLGVSLTNYISDQPSREHKRNSHAQTQADSPEALIKEEIKKLSSELEKKPDDQALRLQLANLLFEGGIRLGNSTFLKDSVGFYHEVLVSNPKQKEALMGLASLSLHVGAADKAKEYYERYLVEDPNDKSAQANLALAIGRAGDTPKAIKLLDKLLKEDKNFVIALVTKGLLLKEQGKVDEAVKLFTEAESLEKNPVLLARIKELKEGGANAEIPEHVNIKDIENYFTTNKVLGPKFVSIASDNKIVTVNLKDFPIEQMPEFAKAKVINSVKQLLDKSDYTSLIMQDEKTKKELLNINSK